MGRPGRQRTRRTSSTTSRSATPLEPRLGGPLSAATGPDELAGETQWSQLLVTADLTIGLADATGGGSEAFDISGCRIVGSRFVQVDLGGARITDTTFEECDLAGASLEEASLTRVHFSNCRLSGVVINAARLRDVRVSDSKADGLSLRMASAERLTCERVQMPDADFYQATLTLARFFDCDLGGADFSNVALDDVRLHGSDLEAVRGVEHLRGVVIDTRQMPDFAAALLAVHRITVDDDRESAPSVERRPSSTR